MHKKISEMSRGERIKRQEQSRRERENDGKKEPKK